MEFCHLSQLVNQNSLLYADQAALTVKDSSTGKWIPVSWKDFSEKNTALACSMCHFGIKPQSNIGIYSQNMAECFYVDFGAFANRAIVVPMYPTASVPQIKYMIEEAEIQLMFVGEQQQYDKAWQALQTSNFLKQIVIFDKSVIKATEDKTSMYFDCFISPENHSSQDMVEVDKCMKEAKNEDIAHIIYTSGTSGEPKGVMLTHNNYLETFKVYNALLFLNQEPTQRYTSISFLPLAHVFEKATSFYALYLGDLLAINRDPKDIMTTVKEIRPESMCTVPRFWEKVYIGVQENIEKSNSITKAIFKNAIATGKKYNLDCIYKGKKPSLLLTWKYNFYSKLVFSKIKKAIGMERGIFFPCGGAMLSEKIITFLYSLGIPLAYGYGLTETTATVSFFPLTDFELGTVGNAILDLEVRIGEDNEIQVKGKTVMSGYYKKPQETAAAFTEDGWFRTGDAGRMTEKSGIILIERIKDLYKTSNGKYIAPQKLESLLLNDKYIENAIIIGDQRKYVTALINPAFEELEKFASEQGIQYENYKDLCNHPSIIELYETRIGVMQNEFANYEQIKKFTLLPELFSVETGELTDTLKMKRSFIAEKYKDVIDKMYD